MLLAIKVERAHINVSIMMLIAFQIEANYVQETHIHVQVLVKLTINVVRVHVHLQVVLLLATKCGRF